MDREQKIEALVEDELSMIFEDRDVARENYRDVLMDGHRGYCNMSDAEVDAEYDELVKRNAAEGQEHANQGCYFHRGAPVATCNDCVGEVE